MGWSVLSIEVMCLAVIATLSYAQLLEATPCNITGEWRDPRHPTTFVATEDMAGVWSVKGPWPGTPHGEVYSNLTLWLQFSGSLSTGVFPSPGCDVVEWTDPPDKAAHNTWCRVGSTACAAPPLPPPPPPPAPPGQLYLSLWGGEFTSAGAVPASPDPLVAYRWNQTAVQSVKLQQYNRHPVRILGTVPTGVTGAQSLLNSSTGTMLIAESTSIAFDFGTECAGWLELRSPDLDAVLAAGSADLLLSSSEYTQPGYTTSTGAKNNNGNCTMAPVATGNGTYRLELNSELYEGLRYGWIHVLNLATGAHVTITSFTAVCQVLPINYVNAAFVADGPPAPPSAVAAYGEGALALASVWYTATYTTRVDLLDGGAFGSILMDRGDRISWTGDAHLAQKAALAAFGDAHGALLVQQNTERTKSVDNGILSYDMYFVLSAVDYYMHTGDTATLAGWDSLIHQKFAASQAFWEKPSTQSFCGSDDRIGADFEHTPPSEDEKLRYYKMLSIQAAAEYSSAVAVCTECSAPMRVAAAQLNTTFSGYFERERSNLNVTYGMHAAAGAVSTGMTTPAEEQSIFDSLLSNPAHICSFSPFNTYFILVTVGRLRLAGGRQQAMRAALDMVRRCYHGMIRLGATTFWETYSPEWNAIFEFGASTPNGQTGYMSHAHPWASGAAPWLTHHVVGIQTVQPAFSTFRVEPFLDGTAPNYLTHIAGAQPVTSGGTIRVAFDCNGTSTLQVPNRTSAVEVILPLCGRVAEAVTINGKPGTLGSSVGDGVGVNVVCSPGNYTFELQFRAESPLASPPSTASPLPALPSYNYRYVGRDCNDSGAWVGQRGSRGHLLFNFDSPGNDNQVLPAGITSVSVAGHNTGAASCPGCTKVNWLAPAACSSDPRGLLPPPASNGTSKGCRGLGGVLAPTTVTVDLLGPPGPMLNVTLYVVDFDRLGREMAIETREYSNLQLGARTQSVANFTEGCMLTFEVRPPVRFRLMQVIGPLPRSDAGVALSAMFFD